MTAQPLHQPDQPIAWKLTPAGHAALDRLAEQLADAIDTSTPESLAEGHAALYAPDLHVMFDHVEVIDEPVPTTVALLLADKPYLPGVVWADGFRQQLPGRWPHYPGDGHEHYRAGHWTRDGEQLVFACCGLDGT
jgi:hypothetical protein